MKKSIIINLLLIPLLYIIPKPNIEIGEVKAKIQETIRQATETGELFVDLKVGIL